MRWCTRQLKIEPFEKYVANDQVSLYVGIRADENREGFISTKPNPNTLYPFREAGITRDDVFRILLDSGVDFRSIMNGEAVRVVIFVFFNERLNGWA